MFRSKVKLGGRALGPFTKCIIDTPVIVAMETVQTIQETGLSFSVWFDDYKAKNTRTSCKQCTSAT